MSRVTPPVKKGVQTFLRSISSTAKVDRPSSILLSSQSHQLRTLADLKQACSLRGLAVSGSKAELLERLNTSELKTNPPSRNHSTLSPHRPLMARPSKRPLMQTFRTSAAPPAAHDTSTIDYMIFPSPSEASESALYKLRVPLLPDNYTPNRAKGTGHEVETPDGPILNQEILVVAAHPEQVLPSAMTEVVGNEGMDDVKLDMAYDKEADSGEQGMIRQIWSGLVDDFLGPKKDAIKPALS